MTSRDIAEDLAFNLYDGKHHFCPSTKKTTLCILAKLLEKAQASMEAWEEYKDPYLTDDENKKEVQIRKKAVHYLETCISKVQNAPDDQAWSLSFKDYPSRVIFRKAKEAW